MILSTLRMRSLILFAAFEIAEKGARLTGIKAPHRMYPTDPLAKIVCSFLLVKIGNVCSKCN